MRLNGKRVLVTGSARGIGRGIAQRFLQEGAKVILLDYREEELRQTAEQLGKPGDVDSVVCDLADADQTLQALDTAWNVWDGLDVCINNAGMATREPFLKLSLDTWDKVIQVNLRSTFVVGQAIAAKMMDQDIKGNIVNMSSKNGRSGSSNLAHYNASKGGIELLTQSMAVELAPYHIRVNAVAPGFIDTPLDRELKKQDTKLELTERTPMKRLGTIEEVANAFLFLASDEASYITGITLVVDGGHLASGSEF